METRTIRINRHPSNKDKTMKKETWAGAEQALKMLNVFDSIGGQFFDIAHANIDKHGVCPKQNLTTIRRTCF